MPQSVRQEMASLVGILSGMNREIKMLREERHEEAASVSKQVDQLRTVRPVRVLFLGRDRMLGARRPSSRST